PSLGWDLTTNPSAPLSLDLRADVGGFYNGRRRGGSVTLAARHASSLTTSLRVEYNDVRLDQGNFVRSLIATRIAYFFTPRVLCQALVQYSNQAQTWTANAMRVVLLAALGYVYAGLMLLVAFAVVAGVSWLTFRASHSQFSPLLMTIAVLGATLLVTGRVLWVRFPAPGGVRLRAGDGP